MPWIRASRIVLVALLGALLLPPAAFSAVRLGSDAEETLTGTHKADQITGGGGNDTLKGKAGNDTYYFANGWGTDTLVERATYNVGGKKKPGGRDTLSFRGVTAGAVDGSLVRQWGPDFNQVFSNTGGGQRVDLRESVVENIVGTRSTNNDTLAGGGEANTLSTGGGSGDTLFDYGGWKDGAEGHPGLPVSSDTFRGAAANTDIVFVQDWGGAKDVLDLRPLASDEVYLAAVDCDADPAQECLQVVTGIGDGTVLVQGQFGEYLQETTDSGQQGRIEILRFADGQVRLDGDVRVRAAGAAGETSASLTGTPLTTRQQQLAERAPALLNAALRELDDQPEPGALPRR
jgi:hypothetical protein